MVAEAAGSTAAVEEAEGLGVVARMAAAGCDEAATAARGYPA